MKVGILGLGLIGASISLKLKEVNDDISVYGFDKNDQSVDFSLSKQIIDKKLDLGALLDFDYLFLAIPVESIKSELSSILDKISEKTLVIDFGSTKYQICNSVSNHIKRGNFLAAHPIAGTEFSGPAAAKKDLFEEEDNGLLKEIRINLLNKEKSSYWKQFSKGLLGVKAYNILEDINNVENQMKCFLSLQVLNLFVYKIWFLIVVVFLHST